MLAKQHENEIKKTNFTFDNILSNNYIDLTSLQMNLIQGFGNDTAIFVYKILKIFYCSTKKYLPKIFCSKENFSCWMDFFTYLMKIDLSEDLIKLENKQKNIFWKIKILAFKITFKIYQK